MGEGLTSDQVREWVHEHADDVLAIDLSWRVTETPDDGAYQRLLEILFTPRPEDRAA